MPIIEEKKTEKESAMSDARQPRAKRAFDSWLNTIILCIVVFLLCFVFMAYMTRITFGAAMSWRDVGFQTALMYVCTVSINLLLRSYARRKGRSTEVWQSARKAIEDNGKRIVNDGLVLLTSTYCREWEERDVDDLRARLLEDVGLHLKDFKTNWCMLTNKEIMAKYPELTKEQRKAIAKAKRVRRLRYDESYLSVRDRIGVWRYSPSGGIKAKTSIKIQTASVMITGAITSLFSVHIAAEIIVNPTFATVIMCLVKIVVLLIFAAVGIIGGYNFAVGREVDEMNDRAEEQNRFLKWCETEKARSSVIPQPEERDTEKIG